jgi:hypothetical protein
MRPGALAWGGTRDAPDGAYSSCEFVEQILAAAAVPQQTPFPIDVTFPGESEPDLVDDWVARNTRPFYTRD